MYKHYKLLQHKHQPTTGVNNQQLHGPLRSCLHVTAGKISRADAWHQLVERPECWEFDAGIAWNRWWPVSKEAKKHGRYRWYTLSNVARGIVQRKWLSLYGCKHLAFPWPCVAKGKFWKTARFTWAVLCDEDVLYFGYFMFLPVWMLMFSPQVKQYIYISCPYLVPFFVHLPRRLDPELQLGSFWSFLRRSWSKANGEDHRLDMRWMVGYAMHQLRLADFSELTSGL